MTGRIAELENLRLKQQAAGGNALFSSDSETVRSGEDASSARRSSANRFSTLSLSM